MPPLRRLRVLVYLVFAAVVTLLFLTSRARHEHDPRSVQGFHHKTVNALDKSHGRPEVAVPRDTDADGDIDGDDERLAKDMAERLRQAEKKAKDNANAKAPNKPDPPKHLIGVGNAASGQRTVASEDKAKVQETEEEDPVETELDAILRKSTVIIFSKSHCPHSKRAKKILLDKYAIDPVPHVVELDKHPLGPKIQSRLADMTGRKTVPNIMVFGKSIGGGDEIAAMDKEKTLANKIRSLGGKWVFVSERAAKGAKKKAG